MSEAERAGTSRQDKSARLLAGRYRLGDVLGRGGMGTVWRAEDETLGRTVAVKELRFPSNIDEEEKRRLITRTLREAKAIARIRNTSAVTVFDVVQEDDRPWIVMELVEGKSLAEVIREDGLLEPGRAAEVGLAVLDVLRSAHREGILHRDVKPSNVLIADDGRVVLTDFGIAQVEGDPSITSTGMLVGAPSYISPERARGHKPGPAADLWSLGGLLYASVEGAPPYDKGSAIATLTAVMTEPLEEPKNAGPLRDVIYGLLAKDPAQRLDDAGARTMLKAVIHTADAEAAGAGAVSDATKVVPLPAQPDAPTRQEGPSGTGGRRGEEAGERLRGALRSVRKAAGAVGAGGTAARAATATPGRGASGAAAAATGGAGAPAAPPASSPRGAGPAPHGDGTDGDRRSGWGVVPPPDLDLPPRPVPRAPLTDVVSRRTLVIIAVAVVLAVLGTVLALTLGGGDGAGAGAKNGSRAGAAAGPSTKEDPAGATGATGAGAGTDGAASPSAPAAPDTGAAPGAGTAPSGAGTPGAGTADNGVATTHRSGQGYTIGLPVGWKFQTSSEAGDRFTGPNGQKLLVGWTTAPKDDPVADWQNQEGSMRRAQYDRIRIEKVDYRGWNTADWEFTYVSGGTKYRSVDRGFVVGAHLGYGLMYTAKADDWNGDLRKNTWRTLTDTFSPKK
ncbi:serine/threonine protein kinase [Streptomyces actuosus]|uniref:non-specific serine/threonine protein kinase n=1 Tax=Streptomyces actuosus TaxID=1885 RepID=A0ABS2VMG6_STRAS|nr:serine/threonine-protein kinase [Streptomyces actuosus]MBN0044281.1 serine/threonine protein kinase [Streptomyces actuosus]